MTDLADRLEARANGLVGYAATHHGIGEKLIETALEAVAALRAQKEQSEPVMVDQETPDDCWTACLASLTGLPLEGFPNAPDVKDPNYEEAALNEIVYTQEVKRHLTDHGWMWRPWSGVRSIPGGYAIATGPSPRRPGFDHCVVVKDGEIVHDPHPSRASIAKIIEYEIVIPLAPPDTEADDG